MTRLTHFLIERSINKVSENYQSGTIDFIKKDRKLWSKIQAVEKKMMTDSLADLDLDASLREYEETWERARRQFVSQPQGTDSVNQPHDDAGVAENQTSDKVSACPAATKWD